MIQAIKKVIKVGSSGAVTIPAKEMKRQNIKFGSEVEVTIRPIAKTADDKEVVGAAKDILARYQRDFENLAKK